MSDETSDPIFDRLGQALPRVTPTDGLLDHILAATDAESRAPAPKSRRPARRRIAWRPTIAISAAAAAIAVAVAIALEPTNPLGPASAKAEITSPAPTNPLTGRAVLYRPTSPGGRLVMKLRNVPPSRPGTHYEVWVLPEGSNRMTAVGSFTPSGTQVDFVLPLPSPGRYRAIDISIQDNNGSPARSIRTLGSGLFQPAA